MTAPLPTLPLGAPVTFPWHRRLRRTETYIALADRRTRTPYADAAKGWAPTWTGDLAALPERTQHGIIVGVRSLRSGDVVYGGEDGQTTFHPTSSTTAYLVAWHLRRAHVLLLPEHVTPVDAS